MRGREGRTENMTRVSQARPHPGASYGQASCFPPLQGAIMCGPQICAPQDRGAGGPQCSRRTFPQHGLLSCRRPNCLRACQSLSREGHSTLGQFGSLFFGISPALGARDAKTHEVTAE